MAHSTEIRVAYASVAKQKLSLRSLTNIVASLREKWDAICSKGEKELIRCLQPSLGVHNAVEYKGRSAQFVAVTWKLSQKVEVKRKGGKTSKINLVSPFTCGKMLASPFLCGVAWRGGAHLECQIMTSPILCACVCVWGG